MAVLLVGEKYSCTPSTLRFFASLRLALEQNCLFLDGHKINIFSLKKNNFEKPRKSTRRNG